MTDLKADYQLRHQLYGRQGSLWERQADDDTKRSIRGIVREAGNASLLSKVDYMAASVPVGGPDKVLVEGASFKFIDGDFAVVGRHQRDYAHHVVVMPDGQRIHVAYRGGSGAWESSRLPTSIARVTADFLRSINSGSITLTEGRDWYLVPIPADLEPQVIKGREPDVFLVHGVDFTVHKGYIAMVEPPGELLPAGHVFVPSAYKRVSGVGSYTLASSSVRGGKFLADYAHKSQSLTAFKRAAAEFAGMYVFQSPDIVLAVHEDGPVRRVYVTAHAGVVEVDYPHNTLRLQQPLPAGYIVCGQYEVVSSRLGITDDVKKAVAAGCTSGLSLNGILPVNGLSWDGVSPVMLDSVVETEGKPHIQMQFNGDTDTLIRFWEFCRLHELQTGNYLYTALGDPSLPAAMDFWEVLDTFYGPQLMLLVAGDHGASINVRLQQFANEHHPKSCVMLSGVALGSSDDILYDSYGVPLLDEYGEYATPSPSTPDYYGDSILSFGGMMLSLGGMPMTYDTAEEDEYY